jgi:hypothetical protein
MNRISETVNKGFGLVGKYRKPAYSIFEMQSHTLKKLLISAAKTSFGVKHNFLEIIDDDNVMHQFQNQVPFHTYDQMFNSWWAQSLEGVPNVCWEGISRYYALSSGTSGASSKYIPVTPQMQKNMRKAAIRIFLSLKHFDISNKLVLKNWLMIGSSASLTKYKKSWVGDLSGINSYKAPLWSKKFKRPNLEISKLKTWEERTEMIVKYAPYWDVSVIAGIPSWVQLTLEKIIDEYKLENIHQIWPNLSLFITGGINFEPYRNNFEQLLARPLQYLDTYLASEGFFAIQDSRNDGSMRLLLDLGIFYEFIHFNEENFDENGNVKGNARALLIDEVEEGVDYAMVISTCAGAWRYIIGDTVVFTSKGDCRIKISGRITQFLSVCGEHLSASNLDQAIANLKDKYNVAIGEYSVGALAFNRHYKHKWFIGLDDMEPPGDFCKLLDDELKILNDDYKAERGAMLAMPEVEFVPKDRFFEWKKLQGKLNGQSKTPRVMKAKQFAEWCNFIQEKKGS